MSKSSVGRGNLYTSIIEIKIQERPRNRTAQIMFGDEIGRKSSRCKRKILEY